MPLLSSLWPFLVVLGVLVFVHEMGHYLAAKAVGIYVHRFSLGIGPPIPWLTFRWGETEYCISWLPLGGYVTPASREGEGTSSLEASSDSAHVPAHRLVESRPVWQRAIFILAGVTMNALFAWFAYSVIYVRNGEQLDPVTRVGRVSDSLPPGAEALATLEPGDRIIAVGSLPVASWGDVVSNIVNAPGDSVVLKLAGRSPVVLPIHSDALEDRIRAAQALQPFRAPVIGQVLSGRPAERAGMAVGDTVLAVNGEPVAQWYDLVNRIQSSAGKELTFAVGRAGKRAELRVTPEGEKTVGPRGEALEVGKIGAGVKIDVISKPYTLAEAVIEGARSTGTSAVTIFRTVRGLVAGRISGRALSGPIGIGQMAAESARGGFDVFLGFMAFVSINLAVLNLLPIPVLDGGQLLFLLAEAVKRKPLSLQVRQRLWSVGLVMVLLLMALGFWNDISRLLARWFG